MSTPTPPHPFNNFKGWDGDDASEADALMVEWAGAAALTARLPPGKAHYPGGSNRGYDLLLDDVGKVEIKKAWTQPTYPNFLCHAPLSKTQIKNANFCMMVIAATSTTMSNEKYKADGTMEVTLSMQMGAVVIVPVDLVIQESVWRGKAISTIPYSLVSKYTLDAFVASLKS